MTNTQALERLKKIERIIHNIRKINLPNGCFKIIVLKQEAKKIGEEFKDGCGETLTIFNAGCGDINFNNKIIWCPTCKEAKEILARINNE